MRWIVATVALFVALVFTGGVISAAVSSSGTTAAVNPCPDVPAATVGELTVPRGPVAGYCQAELVNAAKIMTAARDLGIGTHTQAVGVMTAIGETRLRNLDYGDAAGPDSRGLFQQRDNGAWGTYAQRMDPYTAARTFFVKLTKVPGWQTMEPTYLAHAVQINQDAEYYAQFWDQAQEIVKALTPATH